MLIVFKSTILDGIKLITFGALSNVSVIVSNHFVEESFGFISLSLFHALTLDDINNLDALVVELLFNGIFVLRESAVEF
jgi:hypothetical protein